MGRLHYGTAQSPPETEKLEPVGSLLAPAEIAPSLLHPAPQIHRVLHKNIIFMICLKEVRAPFPEGPHCHYHPSVNDDFVT